MTDFFFKNSIEQVFIWIRFYVLDSVLTDRSRAVNEGTPVTGFGPI